MLGNLEERSERSDGKVWSSNSGEVHQTEQCEMRPGQFADKKFKKNQTHKITIWSFCSGHSAGDDLSDTSRSELRSDTFRELRHTSPTQRSGRELLVMQRPVRSFWMARRFGREQLGSEPLGEGKLQFHQCLLPNLSRYIVSWGNLLEEFFCF